MKEISGWMPNFEELFQQWVITLVEHNSFWLFVGLAIISILVLNLVNNIIHIIKINFEEFYSWIKYWSNRN